MARNRSLGFTLLELIIVILIGSVLLSVTVGRISGTRSVLSAVGARQAYLALHSRTRAQTIEFGSTARLMLDPSGDSAWIVQGGNTIETGFSLAELVVAIVILSFGVLSMAGTSTWVVRQVTLSRITTKRAVARQSAIDEVLADPFDDIAGGSRKFGIFDVTWTVIVDVGSYKTLRVVTVGLGREPGSPGMTTLSSQVADTLLLTVPSPGY